MSSRREFRDSYTAGRSEYEIWMVSLWTVSSDIEQEIVRAIDQMTETETLRHRMEEASQAPASETAPTLE
jgi:tripartite-type tricarboxylate transporter receptor subunit TctC